MRRALFLLLVLLAAGCSPRAQQLTASGVEDAIKTNNATVAALMGLQEKARFARKAALMAASKTAGSYQEGKEKLDAIKTAYDPVFDAFGEAERVSEALATALEVARDAISRGEVPNMVRLFGLATVLQSAYNELVYKMSEVP